jgi:hypothetical protein
MFSDAIHLDATAVVSNSLDQTPALSSNKIKIEASQPLLLAERRQGPTELIVISSF